MEVLKVAIYARMSTTDQNCELQLSELRDYAGREGWTIAGEYVDTGFSADKTSRPALDRIMQAASQHEFDCILVWKIDRFSRSLPHLMQQLGDLDSAGVRFIAVTQGIDTDPHSRMARLQVDIGMTRGHALRVLDWEISPESLNVPSR